MADMVIQPQRGTLWNAAKSGKRIAPNREPSMV